MIIYLKLFSLFLLNIIKNNPYKLITISLITFHYANTFPDTVKYSNISGTIKIKDSQIYIVESIVDNNIKYECAVPNGSNITFKDNKITTTSYNGLNILMWLISIICFVFLLILTFIDGPDESWEFSYCWVDSYKSLVSCEIEDGKYYYLAMGRLLGIKDIIINQEYCQITKELGIGTFGDIFRCPKYETKQVKRENLLIKLGL